MTTLLACACWLGQTPSAAPFIPADDAVILERLPYNLDPAVSELRALRNRLSQTPADLTLAAALAARYYALGQRQADPRFYGYAESALQPWWTQEHPPRQILLLRAGLRQARHEFDLAMADLNALLASDPRNGEAWLMHAVVQLVRADYRGAAASCKPLFALGRIADSLACFGSVVSMTSRAREGYRLLERALLLSDPAASAQRVRILTLLGKAATRLEQPAPAERHFRDALALDANDAYALNAFADFLLDQDRPQEVVPLLREHIRLDSVLLRLALAERRLAAADLGDHIQTLGARFAASQSRGDNLHLGDEARFRLYLLGDAAGALRLASSNFKTQREYGDIRILLESAVAARQPDAAAPALALLKQSGLSDPLLRRVVSKLEDAD